MTGKVDIDCILYGLHAKHTVLLKYYAVNLN